MNRGVLLKLCLLTDGESYPLDNAWIITMNNHLRDLAKKRFKVSFDDLPEREHRVVQHLGERLHISHDLEFEKKLTLGQRLVDKVANFGG